MRIVFMGTPDFAVASLKILVENNYNVVGVVTMPDKPAGRGHQMQFSAVKQYALEQNLPLLQPEKLKDEAFLEQLRALKADVQVVVAFRMLPEVVWNMPPLGTFNLHASLLPQYRGAAPINWAIINGEKQTGATTFFLTHEIDTGKIILQQKLDIAPTDNAGIVHDKLMVMGAEMVRQTIDMLAAGKTDAVDQVKVKGRRKILKVAPKIFKSDRKINLKQGCEKVNDFVRGLSTQPCAWTEICLDGKNKVEIKVFSIEIEKCVRDVKIGTLKTDYKNYIKIAVWNGYIHLKEIQAPNKTKMQVSEYLRGLRVNNQ